jgi:hypothetical protein
MVNLWPKYNKEKHKESKDEAHIQVEKKEKFEFVKFRSRRRGNYLDHNVQ